MILDSNNLARLMAWVIGVGWRTTSSRWILGIKLEMNHDHFWVKAKNTITKFFELLGIL